jgi:predicted DNA-binding protein
MIKKKEKDLEYKVFSIRLSEEVRDKLKELQRSSGKSWNLFIKELINK